MAGIHGRAAAKFRDTCRERDERRRLPPTEPVHVRGLLSPWRQENATAARLQASHSALTGPSGTKAPDRVIQNPPTTDIPDSVRYPVAKEMSANPLEKLVIDYWYKAIAAAGLFVLILSLTVELVGVSNNAVQLLSLGAFFVGLGEWVNHPLQTYLISASAYHPRGKLTGHPRKSSSTGVLLVLLGAVLLGLGVYKLLA